jgi:hypothetical protein
MSNCKPTFALIGKVDDPKPKSRGGPFILLLDRTLEQENRALFNFDPDTVFYSRAQVKQLDLMTIQANETAFHFFRGLR